MCGIAGIIGPAAADEARIEDMLAVIRHRGPDDEGVFVGDGVALGHRRLSIIDLDGGHQPLADEAENSWIVFNGEIYNYPSLRQDLAASGHRFRTHSDTETLVQLYSSIGRDCVTRLRGMFSFAIWDKSSRSLFAARDHLGQKPFYYAELGDTFVFSSEIKGLLAYDRGLAEMDVEAFDQYLSFRIIASPKTMFRRIRKLPPGHSLVFRPGTGVTIQRYWQPEYGPKIQGSEEDLVDQLEEQVIDSLRHHIVSDVPVGAFVSGGLDSTLVVAMLKKHVTEVPIQTFSVGLPYKEFNEAPYAKMVADLYETQHREQVVTPSLIEHLPDLVWHLDEPSDPLSICSYLISKMASKYVKVVLGGDGGDELFGGYDRYYGNQFASIYAAVPSAFRRYILGPLIGAIPDGGWYKSRSHQLKWLHSLSFLAGDQRYAASLGYFYFNRERIGHLYGPQMADQYDSMDPGLAIREHFNAAMASDNLDRMLYSDSQVRLPDHPVMILDRMTMAHSLEARSPFMDHKLVEFSARLPVRMKVRGRSLRYIQHRLAERYLPDAVLKRPKQGFSSALPYMLKDEYEHLYRVLINDSHLARDGYLRQAQINKYVREHQSGAADHGNRLWLLINSEAWYRMFIGGASRGDLTQDIAMA